MKKSKNYVDNLPRRIPLGHNLCRIFCQYLDPEGNRCTKPNYAEVVIRSTWSERFAVLLCKEHFEEIINEEDFCG